MDLDDIAAAGKLSAESGVPTDTLLSDLNRQRRAVLAKVTSDEGKYTVLGIDRFDHEDFIVGRYDTAEEAIEIARSKTDEAKPFASSYSIATVYYAYDPNGKYIGGNTWHNQENGYIY